MKDCSQSQNAAELAADLEALQADDVILDSDDPGPIVASAGRSPEVSTPAG